LALYKEHAEKNTRMQEPLRRNGAKVRKEYQSFFFLSEIVPLALSKRVRGENTRMQEPLRRNGGKERKEYKLFFVLWIIVRLAFREVKGAGR
jgi:hypothetical protein